MAKLKIHSFRKVDIQDHHIELQTQIETYKKYKNKYINSVYLNIFCILTIILLLINNYRH